MIQQQIKVVTGEDRIWNLEFRGDTELNITSMRIRDFLVPTSEFTTYVF